MPLKKIHVAVIFSHIGPYHLARLSAAQAACQTKGWELTVIQSIQKTVDHPWGNLSETGIVIKTLLSAELAADRDDLRPDSPLAAAAIAPCLNNIQPDVLLIPGWGFRVSRAALRWCRQHRVPAVLMSESKRDDEPRRWWKEQIKSWLYVRKYASAMVGGPAHRDYLIQLGIPYSRIFYGYDVIDNEHFIQEAAIAQQMSASIRQQQPTIPDSPYFLAVTRLLPRKNILRLVEAFSSYCNTVGIKNAWKLVICGSGVETAEIQRLIAKKGLTNLVHLPGFLTYQQIAHWYGLAAAFVHPALVEQWGLVINEACAAGLPILCSHTVGACASLVQHGKNGFTFDPQKTADIEKSLLAIHAMDESDRIKMGELSQSIIASYGPRQFGEGFLNAIHVALSLPFRRSGPKSLEKQ